MAEVGGNPRRRGKPPSPRSMVSSGHWPRASYPDPWLRDAAWAAQRMARAVNAALRDMRLSEDALAKRAGVSRDVLKKVVDGTGWVEFYTAVRLLRASGGALFVAEHRDLEDPPPAL